jgi:F-type H+-transporting ATPase subunit a
MFIFLSKTKTYMSSSNLLSLTYLDPLEQFDVLRLPLLGCLGLTNLSLLLFVNIVVMAVWFTAFAPYISNNYDFALRALYQLVRGVVKENLYVRKQQQFTVLFYLFFTLLLANLVGMIPFSFTITSSFVVTFFLAAAHFIGINHLAVVKHQWQTNDLFLPSGAPLLIAPFLIFIEAVSYIARVFSLSIRLFANMMSGHALLKILIGFSWVLLSTGTGMMLLAVAPWAIVTAIMFLELLIAFLQAYVFTILVTLYINDVLNMHD